MPQGTIPLKPLFVRQSHNDKSVSDTNPLPTKTTELSRYAASDKQPGATGYYGFLDKDGNWYIMKMTLSSIRYIKGTTDYATNWTNRASLTYGYYDAVF